LRFGLQNTQQPMRLDVIGLAAPREHHGCDHVETI
jgi:hypothetical protein